jgi:hypothetical protein
MFLRCLTLHGLTLRCLLHLFLQHLVNHTGVSLAFAGFHDLAYQETDSSVLAGLKVSHRLRILSQNFVHDLANGTFIADLFQTQFFNQSLRIFVVLNHFGKDFLG